MALNRGKRVLLVAPHASYRTAPFLRAAGRLGVEVVLASGSRFPLVSSAVRGLLVDFHDSRAALETILAEAARRPFAGVLGTDDASLELAAAAARELGLPHNDPDAVRIARRKDLARNQLQAAGLAAPVHRRIDLRQQLAMQLRGVAFPCVVKPLALSASRGVIRADNRRQLQAAVSRIGRILDSEPATARDEHYCLLIEDFIPGIEVAVEGMLTAGRVEVLAIFDKPDPLDGPYFEETYYITPTCLELVTQKQLAKAISDACHAYGLKEGPVHAECRINARGIWIIEVATRTIGGLCSRLFDLAAGESLETLVLRHVMGEGFTPQPITSGAGVLMIPIPEAGILRRVEGVSAAQQVPFIEDIVIDVRQGCELTPLPEGSSYLGFIFAKAPTAKQAEAALRKAHACLRVVTAPLWKGALEG